MAKHTGRHVRAIVVLPGTVLVGIPLVLLATVGRVTVAWGTEGALRAVVLGIALATFATGSALLGRSIWLLARIGNGTLAPWDPTTRLVVRDLYRFTRNPMYVSVLLTLSGEAIAFGSWWVVGWLVLVAVSFHLRVTLAEEPRLEREFGDEYRNYCERVPRWVIAPRSSRSTRGAPR